MAKFTSTVGIITNISTQNLSGSGSCALLITMQSEDQGLVNLLLPGTSYVLNCRPFQVGDRATFFYDPAAPTPLIFPPQYQAVAAAATPHGMSAYLDVFNAMLTSSDGALILNMGGNPPVSLPNGQPYYGELGGKLLLVTYGVTTKSLPAQAMPTQAVVFCR